MIAITSVTNSLDGQSVNIVLAAPPTGTLTITAVRVIGSNEGATVSPTHIAGNMYNALLQPYAVNVPVPYQIIANDNTGSTPAVPVWLRYGTNDALPIEIQKAIGGILTTYKPLLDLYLANAGSTIATPTVQKIITNNPIPVKAWPAIAVDAGTYNEEWYGLPVTRIITVRTNISCGFIHNTATSYIDIIKALGQSVHDVLNQQQFAEITMPSGLQLINCACNSFEAEEFNDGAQFVAMATIGWSGQLSWPEM